MRVRRHDRVHPRKRLMLAVVLDVPDVVDVVVVHPQQPLRAILIFPYPFLEPILDLLDLGSGLCCLCHIDACFAFVVLRQKIVLYPLLVRVPVQASFDGDALAGQCRLKALHDIGLNSAPLLNAPYFRSCLAIAILPLAVSRPVDFPFASFRDVLDFNRVTMSAKQFCPKCFDILRWNPRRAHLGRDFVNANVFRLGLLQCGNIRFKLRIDRRRCLCLNQLAPNVSRQVDVGRLPSLLRILECQSSFDKLKPNVSRIKPGKFCDMVDVHATESVQTCPQSIGHVIGLGESNVAANRAALEHIILRCRVFLGAPFLQRLQ